MAAVASLEHERMQAEMDPVGIALDVVVVWALAARTAATTVMSDLKIFIMTLIIRWHW